MASPPALQYVQLLATDGETPVLVPSSSAPTIWPVDDNSCRIYVAGAAFDVLGSAELIAEIFVTVAAGGSVRITEEGRFRITENGEDLRVTEETT